MRIRTVWLVAALAIAGCFRPSFDDLECSPGGDCPPGFACDRGVCVDPDDVEPDPGDTTDAAPPEPDAPAPDEDCDPVAQTGCDDGDKCSFVVTRVEGGKPVDGKTQCLDVTGDPVGEGQDCGYAIEGANRVDRACQKGLQCSALVDGTCRDICAPLESPCGDGDEKSCASVDGLFGDLESTGLCLLL